jgi:hypothetical protein
MEVYMNVKLENTIAWLYRNGRPLDVARYQYLFLNKDQILVEEILKSYQNADGGFGHGLEPDSQNPFSSPITTWMAFEVIDELGLDNNHEIVQKTIKYLTEVAPKRDGLYLSTIPTNNIYPHAPWWTYSPEGSVWGYNPSIAIAGFIYKHHITKEQKSQAAELIQRGINDFLKDPSDNMHEIRAFLDMVNYVKNLTNFDNHEKFLNKLLEQVEHTLEKNPDLWFKAYCTRPLQYFDKPNTFGYDKFEDLAKLEASMILSSLNRDSIWDVTWDWDQYPEAKVLAIRDWQSSLIIGYLKILNNYDLLN